MKLTQKRPDFEKLSRRDSAGTRTLYSPLKYYVICGRLLTPHSFSAILGKSIAQSNANEKGPIVRKMQIDSICSTVSSPISSLPSQENSGRGSALRCLMDIYVLIGLAHGCVLVGFPSVQDKATFRDKGTEVSSLSWDKGTTGQVQNLATERAGTVF